MELKALIDRAVASVLGGKAEVASSLGISTKRLADYRYGVRPTPIEKQVLLCDLAGLTDEECRAHLREAAGAPAPKPSLIHSGFALAAGLSTVFGAVLLALHRGIEATMYIGQTPTVALRPVTTTGVL